MNISFTNLEEYGNGYMNCSTGKTMFYVTPQSSTNHSMSSLQTAGKNSEKDHFTPDDIKLLHISYYNLIPYNRVKSDEAFIRGNPCVVTRE
jgi:hypothetical protein